MQKKINILAVVIFLSLALAPLLRASEMPEFICEIGMQFYRAGRYDEALHEFKKALLVQSDYAPALRYIQMIEQLKHPKEVVEEKKVILLTFKPTSKTLTGIIQETLDLVEIQREMIQEKQLALPKKILPGKIRLVTSPLLAPPAGFEAGLPTKEIIPPKILVLDKTLSEIPLPIEIEQGKAIIILGQNIKRFLVTQPEIITVEKKSPDELLATGKDFGYTYLHVWDDVGRWTIEFLGVFAKPEGPTYEEQLRRQEELARNFKLRYNLSWSLFESGRRINTLNRLSYSWAHSLGLYGPTPYGDLDSLLNIRRSKTNVDLTGLTLGLTNGQLGQFKGFSLRAFDFSPYFSNLAFGGATLRGGMLTSEALNNKLNYTAFWGREGGGRFGNLSPELTKIKHSFLDGFNLDYAPTQKQDYQFTMVSGWGRERDNFLNRYSYDLGTNWVLDDWNVGYEVSHDSEEFAQLFKTRYTQKKLNFAAELRNIARDFLSIGGRGWRQGQLGGLFNLNYRPTERLGINSNLDVYKDRLYPAEDNEDRWNENFNLNASYHLDAKTSLNSYYAIQNDLGTISQSRYQSAGVGLSKGIKFIKDISTYANYAHQEINNFSSPNSDYINDQFFAGLRFSLIQDLYYYFNKEINWVQERYTATWAHPHALEMGLDWSHQIGKTPLYGSFRFTYRDEEKTDSILSFLSGEDYIQGSTELSYRPDGDKEIYGSCSVRNVWAEKSTAGKRQEASFNAGMRYLWDTGVHWEAVGNIEGYVFRDLNSDGLRQRDEAPLEGIKIWLGKDKSQLTDMFGYYKFKGVKARKVYVNLDTSTLPSGYVLTVPVTQEVGVLHHHSARVDFGVISHAEVNGMVFEDIDENGVYNLEDRGIKGVVVTLEDGSRAVTDGDGRYSFPNAPPGEHTLTIDLNSIPVYYLPEVAMTNSFSLHEGDAYVYNVPLKRIKE